MEEEQTNVQNKYPFLSTHAVDSDQITKHFKDQSSFQYEIIQPPDSTVETALNGQKAISQPKITPVREAPPDFMQCIKDMRQSRDKYDQIALAFERRDALVRAKLQQNTKKHTNKRRFRGESEERAKKEEIVSNSVISSYLRGDRIEIDGATAAERFLEEEQEFNMNKSKHLSTGQRMSPDNQAISSISSIFYGNSSLMSCCDSSQNRNSSSQYCQDSGFSPFSQLPTLSSPLSLRSQESPSTLATFANNSNSPYLQVKNNRHFSQSTNNSHFPQISSPAQGAKPFPLPRDQQTAQKTNRDLPKQRLIFQELMSQIERVREGDLDDQPMRNDDYCTEQSMFPVSEIEMKSQQQQRKDIGQVSMYFQEQLNARVKKQQGQGQARISMSSDNHHFSGSNQFSGVSKNLNQTRNNDISKNNELNREMKKNSLNLKQEFSSINKNTSTNRNSPNDDQFSRHLHTDQHQSARMDGINLKNKDILLILPESKPKNISGNMQQNAVQPAIQIQTGAGINNINSQGFIFSNIPTAEKQLRQEKHSPGLKGRKLNVSKVQRNNDTSSALPSLNAQNQPTKALEKQSLTHQKQLENRKISDDLKTNVLSQQTQPSLASDVSDETPSQIGMLPSEQQTRFNQIGTKKIKLTNNTARVKSKSFIGFENQELEVDSASLQQKQKLFSPQNKPRHLSSYLQAYPQHRSRPFQLAKVDVVADETDKQEGEKRENSEQLQSCYEPLSLQLHPCANTTENQEQSDDSLISEELENDEKDQQLDNGQQQQENKGNCQELRQQSQQVRVRVLSLPVVESRQKINRKSDLVVLRSLREAAALAEKQRKRSSTFQIQQQELMSDSILGNNSQRKQTRNRQSRILQNYQAVRAPLLIKNKIDKEFADVIAFCPNL